MASPIMTARKMANWPPGPDHEEIVAEIARQEQAWLRSEQWKNTIAKILPTDISRPNLTCHLCNAEATRYWDDGGWKIDVYPPLCDRSAVLCPDCVDAYAAVIERFGDWKWE